MWSTMVIVMGIIDWPVWLLEITQQLFSVNNKSDTTYELIKKLTITKLSNVLLSY